MKNLNIMFLNSISTMPSVGRGDSATSIIYRIRFGMPSRDCIGLGICDAFRYDPKRYKKTFRFALAELIYDSGELAIAFHKKSMDRETTKMFFGSGVFLVEEAFDLSAVMEQEKAKPGMLILEKGSYDIEDAGDFFVIRL